MVQQIKDLLEKKPFEPFTIFMSDGREYRIPTPDHAHVLPNSLGVYVFTDTSTFALPMRQVSGVSSPLLGA